VSFLPLSLFLSKVLTLEELFTKEAKCRLERKNCGCLATFIERTCALLQDQKQLLAHNLFWLHLRAKESFEAKSAVKKASTIFFFLAKMLQSFFKVSALKVFDKLAVSSGCVFL